MGFWGNLVDSVTPKSWAQGIKMGLQAGADAVSFAPPPFHFIGAALEAGACVSGMFDPNSSREAELAEFAMRGPLSLIPASGAAKIALKTTAKGVTGLVANVGTNWATGKFHEINYIDGIKMMEPEFEKAMAEKGIDYKKLPAEQKAEMLANSYKTMQAQGINFIDSHHTRLTIEEFKAKAEQRFGPVSAEPSLAHNEPAKMMPASKVNEQAINMYLDKKGIKLADLGDKDKAEILELTKVMRTNLESKGYQIIERPEEKAIANAAQTLGKTDAAVANAQNLQPVKANSGLKI